MSDTNEDVIVQEQELVTTIPHMLPLLVPGFLVTALMQAYKYPRDASKLCLAAISVINARLQACVDSPSRVHTV